MSSHSYREWASLAPKLIAVAQSWRRAIAQALAEDGLSDATALPLVHLLRDGGGIRQNRLAERIGVESTALVRVLDGLERGGLVTRCTDPEDGRAKLVSLTADGKVLAERAEEVFDQLRSDVMGDTDPDDLKATLRALDCFAEGLSRRSGQKSAG